MHIWLPRRPELLPTLDERLTAAAALVLTLEGKWDRRLLPALGLYGLFLLSWLPITLGCLVKQTTQWEEIRHTRNVAPQPGGKSRQALMP